MKHPTLRDLTKDELIALIQERIFRIEPREIALLIWKREQQQASEAMERANEKIQALCGGSDLAAFVKANEEFDRAFKASQLADDKWNKWRDAQ